MARMRIDPDLLQDATLRVLKSEGLTQQGLAERVGVSLGTVGNWARGNGGRVDSVAKLAQGFPSHISLDDLLVGEGQPGATATRLESMEAKLDQVLAELQRIGRSGDSGDEFDQLIERVEDADSIQVRDVTRRGAK